MFTRTMQWYTGSNPVLTTIKGRVAKAHVDIDIEG